MVTNYKFNSKKKNLKRYFVAVMAVTANYEVNLKNKKLKRPFAVAMATTNISKHLPLLI